jgi:hypothetical protein
MPELREHRLILFAGLSPGPSIRELFVQHATNREGEDPLDSLPIGRGRIIHKPSM